MPTSLSQPKSKVHKVVKSPAKPAVRHRIVKSTANSTANVKPSGSVYYVGIGRRKTAVARVRMYGSETPEIIVNGKKLNEYFPQPGFQDVVRSPLVLCGKDKEMSLNVKVSGGGTHGQAEAVRHGVSRALLKLEAAFRPTLKPHGFLTRDSRMKERKKPGLKRARRAPQWQKR